MSWAHGEDSCCQHMGVLAFRFVSCCRIMFLSVMVLPGQLPSNACRVRSVVIWPMHSLTLHKSLQRLMLSRRVTHIPAPFQASENCN